jgi:hypothetical protein
MVAWRGKEGVRGGRAMVACGGEEGAVCGPATAGETDGVSPMGAGGETTFGAIAAGIGAVAAAAAACGATGGADTNVCAGAASAKGIVPGADGMDGAALGNDAGTFGAVSASVGGGSFPELSGTAWGDSRPAAGASRPDVRSARMTSERSSAVGANQPAGCTQNESADCAVKAAVHPGTSRAPPRATS